MNNTRKIEKWAKENDYFCYSSGPKCKLIKCYEKNYNQIIEIVFNRHPMMLKTWVSNGWCDFYSKEPLEKLIKSLDRVNQDVNNLKEYLEKEDK